MFRLLDLLVPRVVSHRSVTTGIELLPACRGVGRMVDRAPLLQVLMNRFIRFRDFARTRGADPGCGARSVL